MVKVDEFDAVGIVAGSFGAIDEEEGNDDEIASSDADTASTSPDGVDSETRLRPDPSRCTDSTATRKETEADRTSSTASRDFALSPAPHRDNVPSTIDEEEDVENMFRRARQFRHNRYTSRPYGILGLYQHLGDVRSDYDWARTAVRRRKQRQPYLPWIEYQELQVRRNKCRTRALRWFANGMFLASTVLLLVSFAMNGWRLESMSVNPMVGPNAATLLRLGALQRSNIVVKKQWYRIVTAVPLHTGVLHWLMNGAAMLWMSRSCVRAETSSCSRHFIVAFVVAAIGGNVCSAAYSPFTVSMGASGGLFGWLGYCLADAAANFRLLSRSDDGHPFPRRTAIAWLALELVLLVGLGMTPYVDNFAHTGGFLAGIGIGWSYQCSPKTIVPKESALGPGWSRHVSTIRNHLRRHWTTLVVMCVILLHVGFLARSESNQDVCKKCRYLSCVEFPFWTETKWWRCDSCEHCSVATIAPNNNSNNEGGSRMSWLEITCPYGDVLKRPYPHHLTSETILRTMVPQTCRESCAL
jgi:membrane associated rhomboid family serine protease